MANYLFYSPQLDGVSNPNNVPPMSNGKKPASSSPGLQPGNSMGRNDLPTLNVPDLNLTPQFGPLLGQQRHSQYQPVHREQQHAHNVNRNRKMEMHHGGQDQMSFLSSPMPAGLMNDANMQHLPYFYASPAYNPMAGSSPAYHPMGAAYSPLFGVPSPLMFGVGPDGQSFEPLPEPAMWKNDPSHMTYHQHHQQHQMNQHMYNQQPRDRIAHFSAGHMQHQSLIGRPDLQSKSVLDEIHHGPPHGLATKGANMQYMQTGILPPLSFADMVTKGLVAEYATDQNGSRFIQTKLEDATLEEKQAVFEQILPETLRLCTDVFGNYCIQKFFEHGTPEHKQKLAKKIQYRVLALSLQMYGCRVVQKILESVEVETQKMLIQELDGHVLECVKDQNANHVIQKCIETVQNSKDIEFIIKAFYGRVYDLSTHPYGCRVIQRMLEHCDDSLKRPVLEELMQFVELLAKDQYGNYVLQHVLQHSPDDQKIKIVRIVANNVLEFSKHKFASNVVERCFISTDTRMKDILLSGVVGTIDNSPLVAMVRDQYGNYVIQKMLETLNVPQRNKLIKKISEFVPNIRKIAFGKHIVASIKKLTGQII